MKPGTRTAAVLAVLAALLASSASPLVARDIRILTPYLGVLRDKYEDPAHGVELDDTSFLKGIYFQWINPERFQCNTFLYQSSDINYSTLWGGHVIFDYYYDVREKHKNVVGVGFDFTSVDMDAEDNLAPLSDFTLSNTIYATYLRAGRYFYFGGSNFDSYLFPWLGVEFEFVRGDVSFVPPGPPSVVEEDIDEDYVFSLAGLKFRSVIYHFFELEANYYGRFRTGEYLSDVTLMTNVYLGKKWGLSYRFKYMENVTGSLSYHLFGPAFVF